MSTLGLAQVRQTPKCCLGYRRYHHLCYAHTAFDRESLTCVIDHDDANFSAVICINCAGCVEAGNAMFEGVARPWSYLHFEAGWNFKA